MDAIYEAWDRFAREYATFLAGKSNFPHDAKSRIGSTTACSIAFAVKMGFDAGREYEVRKGLDRQGGIC